MVAFSLMIMIRNVAIGIREVPRDVVDAAVGMGMNRVEVLTRIELPLALPVIVAGPAHRHGDGDQRHRRRRVRQRRRPRHADLRRHQQRLRAEDLDRRAHRVRAGGRGRSRPRAPRSVAAAAGRLNEPRHAGDGSAPMFADAWAYLARASAPVRRRAVDARRAVRVGARHRDRDRRAARHLARRVRAARRSSRSTPPTSAARCRRSRCWR